ncbi:MAG: hypothetical protein HY696_00400 [Deltaproteobacteria bacterium]|nr:hypothetical protein [Deltaproteobacteria bacterium]
MSPIIKYTNEPLGDVKVIRKETMYRDLCLDPFILSPGAEVMLDFNVFMTNEFAAFFSRHPNITRVFFNGTKADDCYRRHVLPNLHAVAVRYARLPSTSPANASIPYPQKLAAWRVIVE